MSEHVTDWSTVISVNHDNPQPPVRCCLICDRYERPVNGLIQAVIPYLCDECKLKLKSIIEKEKQNEY